MNPENNLSISGDEARVLMAALATATASVPASTVITLWFKLSSISNVQPPKLQGENSNV